MAMIHGMKWRERQRRVTRQRWMLAGGVLLLIVLALARHKLHQHPTAPADPAASAIQRTALGVVHRRSLRMSAAVTEPNTQLDAHRLVVMLPDGAGPEWQQAAIQAAVSKAVQPLAVDWHTGTPAASLAQYFGIEKLPGAALIPPFCRVADCEAPRVWHSWDWHPRGEAAPSPLPLKDALAAWAANVSAAWLLLANDFGDTLTFRQQLPGAAPDSSGREAEISSTTENPNVHELAPGGREWVRTPVQARWTATRGEEGGSDEVVARHTVRGDAIMTVRPAGDCNFFTDPGCELPRPNKKFPEKVLQAREDADEARLDDIRNQSSTIRHYTKRGFEKRRAPRAMFHSLHSYFEAHAANYSREEWEDEDIFVNHDQSQFLLVDIPEAGPMRRAIYDSVQRIFEQWAGGVSLKPTAIYGVRVYTAGNILKDHVDVAETHHVSAIVNVDQDVDEPWPLEIYGHDGKAHQAVLEPGDMLLYEGATCAHGRPTPLKGRWMANIFVHFAPVDVLSSSK